MAIRGACMTADITPAIPMRAKFFVERSRAKVLLMM